MERNDDRAAAKAARLKYRREQAANTAAVQSIAICFVTALIGILFFSYVLAFMIATAGAAFGVARLDLRAFGDSLGRPPRMLDLPLGVAGAVTALLVAWLYLGIMYLFIDARELEWVMPRASIIFIWAILPALLEEWTCRGALWTICRRVTTPRATLVITSVLFGLLHAPGWGWAGVPSRILQGVVYGILRLRTGGLAAPTIAHMLNNLVAVGFVSGM
ncbi:MAG: lysostaphin resistance A-like protein [Planctomycetota bacterium]